MEQVEYDSLLNLVADMGCALMSSGAEIYRVEESMYRLLRAYDLPGAEVFAIPNCIIVSVNTPDGHACTRMRRIGAHGTDIELLERCNDLCRTLCVQTPPLEEAKRRLADIPARRRRFSTAMNLFGYGLAPAFFAPLFGGSFLDMAAAFAVGLTVGLFQLYGGRFFVGNSFFHTALSSAAASLAAVTLVRLGLGNDVDTITISALMMLVPGVALTNAMREIMAGDTISALSHAADALLCAVAIALGSAVSLAFIQML